MVESRGAAARGVRGMNYLARRLLERVRSLGPALMWRAKRWSVFGHGYLKRPRLNAVTFVAITGSAGKTGAKDLSAAVLEVLGPCQMSSVSTNDHFGVAETVLRTTRAHRFSVVEMGAPGPGYLDRSMRLVRPRIGVLTLVARDHFTRFKSVEAIAAEKGKVVSALPSDGIAVLNIDDPLVRAIGERCGRRVIWIGQGEGATVRLREAHSRYPRPLTLKVDYAGQTYEVATTLHGTQQALSVLVALGVGVAAGVPLGAAIAALARASLTAGRMQIMKADNGVVFVRDDWKAPLWSFPAPLQFMREAQAVRKVVVIGTLSDYSLSASKVYPKVARDALEVGELVVFVGPHALRALKARRNPDDRALHGFPDIRDAADFLRAELRAGDLVLVKGSHKADHLTRLILNYLRPIGCWDDRCRRGTLCESCPQLRAAQPGGGIAIAAPRPQATVAPMSAAGMPVIVGLGNPGDLAHCTPHNVGQRVLERIVATAGSAWETQAEGLVADAILEGVAVKLFRPATSMNRCGPAVRGFLERVGGDARRCVLIHDDMDLELGDVRTKRDGGDAGHKGVRSILSSLGMGDMHRVRIGVRRAGDVRKAREIVLKPFLPEEEAALAPALERAAALVQASIRAGLPHAGAAEARRTAVVRDTTNGAS